MFTSGTNANKLPFMTNLLITYRIKSHLGKARDVFMLHLADKTDVFFYVSREATKLLVQRKKLLF